MSPSHGNVETVLRSPSVSGRAVVREGEDRNRGCRGGGRGETSMWSHLEDDNREART